MNPRKPYFFVCFFGLPGLLLLLSLGYFLSAPEAKSWGMDLLLTVTTLFSCVVSLLLAGAGAWLLALDRRAEAARGERDTLLAMHQEYHRKTVQLEGQVELLTAMRDMSRVANDNLKLEEQITNILSIIGGILDSRAITIYIQEEQSERLQPRVFSAEGRAHFDAGIPGDQLEDVNVREAFEYQRTFSAVESHTLFICTPLIADGVTLGVFQVMFDLRGSPEDQTDLIDKYSYIIESITKHISLPIKTSYLYDQAVLDVLTKLYTKRHLLNELAKAFEVAKTQGRPLSVIMSDIDNFKKINDTYGHGSGDIVLAGVADVVRTTIRTNDAGYRYGGEELCVLLFGSTVDKALEVAERIRSRVEKRKFDAEDGRRVMVTVSLGVAEFAPDMKEMNELISRADQALYYSKHHGKNQATVWKPELAEAESKAAK